MPRLPVPNSDGNAWGDLLNEFLCVAHREDGALRGVIEVVNVKDFGAVGDGISDDTAAIQATLDAVQAAGTVVLPLPPAHYRTNRTLRITKSLRLVGGGILPTIGQDGFAEPVITVDAPVNSTVIIDNAQIIGGSCGLHLTGGGLTRHTRFRNLDIHGCVDAAIDIDTGMIGAQFENIRIGNSPDYGLRCLNTSHIISVRFVTCRIVQTRVAAVYFAHPHPSSVHGISFVSPIVEANKGAGFVFKGGYLISIDNVHFENNGIETGGPDLDLGANEHLRAICDVQLVRGIFSAPSEKQVANDAQRIVFSSHHVALTLMGTLLQHTINANNHTAGVNIAFVNTPRLPRVINYPSDSYMALRYGHLQLGRGLATAGLAQASGLLEEAIYPLNLRGSTTLADADVRIAVAFATAEPDPLYFVLTSVSNVVGAPPSGALNTYVTDKAVGGFWVNLLVAPGSGNTVTVDWLIVR